MATLLERVKSHLTNDPPAGLDAWLEGALTVLDPGIQLDAAAPALARHLANGAPLDTLAAADLLRASACVGGDPKALAAFDRLLCTEVRRAVGPLDTSNTLVEEVTQLVRERLLVPVPSSPCSARNTASSSRTLSAKPCRRSPRENGRCSAHYPRRTLARLGRADVRKGCVDHLAVAGDEPGDAAGKDARVALHHPRPVDG